MSTGRYISFFLLFFCWQNIAFAQPEIEFEMTSIQLDSVEWSGEPIRLEYPFRNVGDRTLELKIEDSPVHGCGEIKGLPKCEAYSFAPGDAGVVVYYANLHSLRDKRPFTRFLKVRTNVPEPDNLRGNRHLVAKGVVLNADNAHRHFNLRGRVTDKRYGLPPSGVVVEVSGVVREVNVNADGSFVVRNVPKGVHSVEIWAPGYEGFEIPMQEFLADEYTIEVQLEKRPCMDEPAVSAAEGISLQAPHRLGRKSAKGRIALAVEYRVPDSRYWLHSYEKQKISTFEWEFSVQLAHNPCTEAQLVAKTVSLPESIPCPEKGTYLLKVVDPESRRELSRHIVLVD